MTTYETYKQQYKDNKRGIRFLTKEANQPAMIQFFGEDSVKILHLILKLYKEKLDNPKNKNGQFDRRIIFSTEFVKEHTGLSRDRQIKAINELTKYKFISEGSAWFGLNHRVRYVEINFEYMEEVYIKFGMFNSRFHRLSELSKERLIKLYIETREEKLRLESELWKLENPDLEDLPEDDDFEEEEELL